MRKILALVAFIVILAGGIVTYHYWNSIQHRLKRWTSSHESEQKEIDQTKLLFSQNKYDEGSVLLFDNLDNVNNTSDIGKQWLELLIVYSEARTDLPRLIQIYEFYPKELEGHEKGSLLVASALIAGGRPRDYQELRSHWQGRETKPETWFVLDADKLLQEGKRKEAQELLNGRSFQGPADVPRLVRLALLNVLENPNVAWDYLNQAHTKDPQNSEVLSYRGKLLETYGKNSEAQLEYLAALQTDPKNIFLKDQLAEFYLRRKQYAFSMSIWKDLLENNALDYIWIKTYFWNKVIVPLKFDWEKINHPEGDLKPYLEYLLTLKPDQFWNASEYNKIRGAEKLLSTQQSSFWLRLMQYLKEGDEKGAYTLLQYNPFAAISWNSGLTEALKKILLFRKTGFFTEDAQKAALKEDPNDKKVAASKEGSKTEPQNITVPKDTPFLFAQLDFLSKQPATMIPEDLMLLLKGPEVFSSAFLAAGWDEAALGLHNLSVLPKNYPEWVPLELTLAISRNRSPQEALSFALKAEPTPAMSMIIGELYISDKKFKEAIEHLNKIYKENNETGKRSAWLLSLIYIDQGDLKKAQEILHAQPLLENDVSGKETLARIYLLEKKDTEAKAIYESIAAQSPEAKSYLAKKAYQDKDLVKAKQLTEELLRIYPTNTILQENYKKITEELHSASDKK